MVIGDASVAT